MKIDSFNLSDFDSFRKWHRSLLNSLGLLNNDFPFCSQTFIKLKKHLISAKTTAELFRGKGRLIVYKWPNNELKYLCEMDGLIVGEDDYWLKRYPFVDASTNENSYRIRGDTASICSSDLPLASSLLLPSHNLHFGHFIADDLPWLSAFSLLLSNYSLSSENNALPGFVQTELDCLSIVPYRILAVLPPQALAALPFEELIKGKVGNWAARSFLLRKHIHRKVTELAPSRNNPASYYGKKILVLRNSDIKSRVANLSELVNFLVKLGFEIAYLDGMSLLSTKALFSNCELAISECGTTTLATAVCLPESATLITLMPRPLLSNPTSDMLNSGLPYALFFHQNIRIVLGIERTNSSIQSSIIAWYDVDMLFSIIKSSLYS